MSLTDAALMRLKEQRDKDYYSKWYPGKQLTDAELLWAHIQKLKDELSLAKDDAFLRGWQTNPDRMGGQFDQSDYDQLERGRQGIFG